jgi:hypothetical protein
MVLLQLRGGKTWAIGVHEKTQFNGAGRGY